MTRLEFARLAEALRAAPTPTRTAKQIEAYVRQQLHADHAGITLIRNRHLESVAVTEQLVRDRLTFRGSRARRGSR